MNNHNILLPQQKIDLIPKRVMNNTNQSSTLSSSSAPSTCIKNGSLSASESCAPPSVAETVWPWLKTDWTSHRAVKRESNACWIADWRCAYACAPSTIHLSWWSHSACAFHQFAHQSKYLRTRRISSLSNRTSSDHLKERACAFAHSTRTAGTKKLN